MHELCELASFVTTIHLSAIDIDDVDDDDFDSSIFASMRFPKLTSLVIDSPFCYLTSDEDLRELLHFPITQVHTCCFRKGPQTLYSQLPVLFDMTQLTRVVVDSHMSGDEIQRLKGLPVTDVILDRTFNYKMTKTEEWDVVGALKELTTIKRYSTSTIFHSCYNFTYYLAFI